MRVAILCAWLLVALALVWCARLFASQHTLARTAIAFSVCALWALAAVSIAARGTRGRFARIGWLAAGSALVWFFALLVMFAPTDYPLGGVSLGDARFAAALVVKAFWYGAGRDFAYRQLSAFYPPLLPLIAGRTAALLHLSVYRTSQLVDLVAYCALVPLAYWAFRPHIGPRAALSTALIVILPRVEAGLWKPAELVSATLLCPLWLSWWQPKQRKPRWLLLQGLAGAALFTTFYYPFFVATVDLGRRMLAALGRKRLAAPKLAGLRNAAPVLLLAALLSSWYWGPLFVDILRHPFASFQNRWFQLRHVGYSLLSAFDLVSFLGLATLVLGLPTRRATVAGLRGFFCAGLLWLCIANLAAAADTPLLAQRAWPVLDVVLTAAGTLAADHLLTRLPHPLRARRLALLLVLPFAVGVQSLVEVSSAASFDAALSEKSSDVLDALQDARFAERVVLSTSPAVPAVTPLFGFSSHNAFTSHPSAEFMARVALMRQIVRAQGPALCDLLLHNRFDRIDYIFIDSPAISLVLDRYPRGLRSFRIKIPASFPTAPCVEQVPGFPEGGRLYEVKPLGRD